jgi:hypothetical protein
MPPTGDEHTRLQECRARLRPLLQQDVFSRVGVTGHPDLQDEISKIANNYLEVILIKLEERDADKTQRTPRENILKEEHSRRVNAHLADMNKQSVQRLLPYEAALNDYFVYSEHTRFGIARDVATLPVNAYERERAAKNLAGSVIKNVLDSIGVPKTNDRFAIVPLADDSRGFYTQLLAYQEQMLDLLDGQGGKGSLSLK